MKGTRYIVRKKVSFLDWFVGFFRPLAGIVVLFLAIGLSIALLASQQRQVVIQHAASSSNGPSMDTFDRPDQNGWGIASDGNTWFDDSSIHPGTQSSIINNQGYTDTYSNNANADLDEWMGATYTDQLISADFEMPSLPNDEYEHGPRLLGRVTDAHHYIFLAVNYPISTLQVWQNNNENWIMLKQVSVPTFQPGQWYHAKLLLLGSTAYGKIWPVGPVVSSEPDWMITASNVALTSGMGGLRTSNAQIYWDNFEVQSANQCIAITNAKCVTGSGLSWPGSTNITPYLGKVWGNETTSEIANQCGTGFKYQPYQCGQPYQICCVPSISKNYNQCSGGTLGNVYNQCGGTGCATQSPGKTIQVAHYNPNTSTSCYVCQTYSNDTSCPAN